LFASLYIAIVGNEDTSSCFVAWFQACLILSFLAELNSLSAICMRGLDRSCCNLHFSLHIHKQMDVKGDQNSLRKYILTKELVQISFPEVLVFYRESDASAEHSAICTRADGV
jgi:hypothetical protein